MFPPLSCCVGQLISTHAYAEMPRVIGHLSPRHLPPPTITVIADTYSLVCVRVGMVGRCPRWLFSGDMCLEGGKCLACGTYKRCYDFITIRFICGRLQLALCLCLVSRSAISRARLSWSLKMTTLRFLSH